jgi:uncharacterized Zn finger protein
MSFRSYHGFRPYVPVAERRLRAQKAAKKLAGKGRALAPVQVSGRAIATTFWGQAWCRNLESYSDYANRLPRGRTYVRNGSVIDLQVAAGAIRALVQGSSLYTVTIKIDQLAKPRWRAFKKQCAGGVGNLLDLLQGRLSQEILTHLTAHGTGLFPSPKEITLGCSCPDWADMCKHVAAVLYGVGARLDHEPKLFFTLRGVDMQELVSEASQAATEDITAAVPVDASLADADLAGIFGVDIETAAAVPASAVHAAKAAPSARKRRAAKPAAQVPAPSATTARAAKKVAKAAQPARRAQPAQPATPAKPAKPAKPATSAKPTQPARGAQPAPKKPRRRATTKQKPGKPADRSGKH